MFDAYDADSLKLHVDNEGIVWYANGIGPATCSGLTPTAFLVHPSAQAQHIRFLGTPANAHLLLAYHALRIKTGAGKVEVCSPLVCGTRRILGIPELALLAMRTCDLAPSNGGWHEFDRNDYPSYALASMASKKTDTADDTLRMLKIHPVWPALSFIPHLDPFVCARLLALALDPRWYVDTARPHRNAKFNTFFGLNKRNQEFLTLEASEETPYNVDRCQLVLDCWQDHNVKKADLDDPRYFLYRIWAYRKATVRALLRTSQIFLAYLRYNWLAAIYQRTNVLFVPEQFFKRKEEVHAYRAHMAKAYSAE
jgi:hypothetical protein